MTSYADALRSRTFTGSDIATLIEGIGSSGFPISFSSWTPTLTASDSMTLTSTSIVSAKYFQIGKLVFFKLHITGTIGGTPAANIYATLPVNAATTLVEQFAAEVIDGDGTALTSPSARIHDTTAKLNILKTHAGSNYTAGAAFATRVSGFYEAA